MDVKDGILQSIEEYNKMIVTKKLIQPFIETRVKPRASRSSREHYTSDPSLYKSDLKGLFYNYLRRNVFNPDYHFSIDKLHCEFNENGTLRKMNIVNHFSNFTEAFYIQQEVNKFLARFTEVRPTKVMNEMQLIINSIKR